MTEPYGHRQPHQPIFVPPSQDTTPPSDIGQRLDTTPDPSSPGGGAVVSIDLARRKIRIHSKAVSVIGAIILLAVVILGIMNYSKK